MSSFSPSMTLAGMDYIAPSTACVKPTMMAAKAGTSFVGRNNNNIKDEALYAGEIAKISLQDCLACSGCVTTAETILVNAQSREELLRACIGITQDDESKESESMTAEERAAAVALAQRRPVLVTISDASAASLAAHLGTTVEEAVYVVNGFMRCMLCGSSCSNENGGGVRREMYVSTLDWALRESTRLTCEEYEARLLANSQKKEDNSDEANNKTKDMCLPMVVSACPGWVCYCEKQGSALLPHLCAAMSPQGIAGSITKRCINKDVYHVSIQPCYDRKLEAARDGYFPAHSHGEGWQGEEEEEGNDTEGASMTPYTDCVLSTGELLEWMLAVDESLPWRCTHLDSPIHAPAADDEACVGAGIRSANKDHTFNGRMEGSGGYHRRVVEYMHHRHSSAAAKGEEEHVNEAEYSYEAKRNRNHQLVRAASLQDQTFCVAYGFQQIQNIVRGIKKNLPAVRGLTFIEMMACPDGCLNGGGQIRKTDANLQTALLATVEKAFADHALRHDAGGMVRDDEDCAEPVSSSVRREECCADDHHHSTAAANNNSSTVLLFSPERVEQMVQSVGIGALTCTFRDRQAEFEKMLDEGNVHSLKW